MKKELRIKDFFIDFLVFSLVFIFFGMLWNLGFAINEKYRKLDYFPLPEADLPWENKLNGGREIKIGLMNDNHIRPTRMNKSIENSPRIMKSEYSEVFKRFNKKMKLFNPEFIVHLGDGIEGTGDPDYVGISGLELIEKELLANKKPIYWVLGNHELRSVNKEQFKQVVGLENLDYKVDLNNYRFIFLDGNYNPENVEKDFEGYGYIPGFLHPKTLIWLEEQLRTNKRVFVFMHQSILSQEYLNNDQIAKTQIFNFREVMDLLEKYNAEAFFNGHIESRYYKEVEGVKYYSFPGTQKSLDYKKSFYSVLIRDNEVDVIMDYEDPINKNLKVMDFESGKDI